MKKIDWKAVVPYIAIPLALVLCVAVYVVAGQKTKAKTDYSQMVQKFENHEVTEYMLNLTSGVLEYKVAGDDTKYEYTVPNVNITIPSLFPNLISQDGVSYSISIRSSTWRKHHNHAWR